MMISYFKTIVRSRRAITLVELIVTIMVIAILVAVTLPMLSNDATKVSLAANTLLADLWYARSQAIQRQESVTVTFNEADAEYSLSVSGGTLTNPYMDQPYPVSLRALAGENSLTLKSAKTGRTTVVFSPTGEPLESVGGNPLTDDKIGVIISLDGNELEVYITPVTGMAYLKQ